MLASVWRFAGVAVDFFADQAGCDFIEVAGEFGVQFAELGQEHLIYELPSCGFSILDHDRS